MMLFLFLILPLDLLVSGVIALQPGKILRLAALALHGAIVLYAIITTGTTLPDYILRTTSATKFFAACHFLWFTDPLNDYHHELDKPGVTVHPRERSFFYRLYWAECVILNHRAVGWNRQLPYTPPLPVERGWTFLKSRLLRVLGLYLMMDAGSTYISLNPVFDPVSTCDSPLTCQGYKLGFVNVLVFTIAPYAVINLGYYGLSVVAVVTGISPPRYWPDLFGSPTEAYTVRRFWGRFWHQMLRPFVASMGKATARSFGFAPGTSGSVYTQIFVAFIISGIIHAAGDIHMGEKHLTSSIRLFGLQAFAIAFEDMVIAAARKSGLDYSTFFNRWAGYSWVCVWFGFLMPYMMRWCVDMGFTRQWLFPFSVTRFALSILEKNYGIDIPSWLFN